MSRNCQISLCCRLLAEAVQQTTEFVHTLIVQFYSIVKSSTVGSLSLLIHKVVETVRQILMKNLVVDEDRLKDLDLWTSMSTDRDINFPFLHDTEQLRILMTPPKRLTQEVSLRYLNDDLKFIDLCRLSDTLEHLSSVLARVQCDCFAYLTEPVIRAVGTRITIGLISTAIYFEE